MNSYDKIKFLELSLQTQSANIIALQAEVHAVRSEVNMLKGINTSGLQEMLELRQYVKETTAKSLANKISSGNEAPVTQPYNWPSSLKK